MKRSRFPILILAIAAVTVTECALVWHYFSLAKSAHQAVQAEIQNRFATRTSTSFQKYISFRNADRDLANSKSIKHP